MLEELLLDSCGSSSLYIVGALSRTEKSSRHDEFIGRREFFLRPNVSDAACQWC